MLSQGLAVTNLTATATATELSNPIFLTYVLLVIN